MSCVAKQCKLDRVQIVVVHSINCLIGTLDLDPCFSLYSNVETHHGVLPAFSHVEVLLMYFYMYSSTNGKN